MSIKVKKTSTTMLLFMSLSLMLSSCDLMFDILNDTLQTDNGDYQLMKLKHQDDVRDKKEDKRLRKEGKCLTCKGRGVSVDGNYICSICEGTGESEARRKPVQKP